MKLEVDPPYRARRLFSLSSSRLTRLSMAFIACDLDLKGVGLEPIEDGLGVGDVHVGPEFETEASKLLDEGVPLAEQVLDLTLHLVDTTTRCEATKGNSGGAWLHVQSMYSSRMSL